MKVRLPIPSQQTGASLNSEFGIRNSEWGIRNENSFHIPHSTFRIRKWVAKESNLSSPPQYFLTPGLQSGEGNTTRCKSEMGGRNSKGPVFETSEFPLPISNCKKCSEQDSNLQSLGLKPSRSTDGVPELFPIGNSEFGGRKIQSSKTSKFPLPNSHFRPPNWKK